LSLAPRFWLTSDLALVLASLMASMAAKVVAISVRCPSLLYSQPGVPQFQSAKWRACIKRVKCSFSMHCSSGGHGSATAWPEGFLQAGQM
jgi:hypothetical protein